jgi:predicted ATPase
VHEALALAQERGHLLSLVMAQQHAGTIAQLCREVPATQTHAEAVVALATEYALPYWLACGMVIHGWAGAIQGQGQEAVTQIRQSLTELLATGTRMIIPYFLGLLAEACMQAGLIETGLTTVAEAFTTVQQTGECGHEAELYRLKGELLLQGKAPCCQDHVVIAPPIPQPPYAAAEACFLQALAIARHQRAKSLELRAALSVSRLWQQQNKYVEARQLLTDIYAWFTEGFNTVDLQEARALLEAYV